MTCFSKSNSLKNRTFINENRGFMRDWTEKEGFKLYGSINLPSFLKKE